MFAALAAVLAGLLPVGTPLPVIHKSSVRTCDKGFQLLVETPAQFTEAKAILREGLEYRLAVLRANGTTHFTHGNNLLKQHQVHQMQVEAPPPEGQLVTFNVIVR